jgi:hypothetical protein
MNRPAAWLLGSRKSSSRKLFGVALMAASALRVIRLLAIVGRESNATWKFTHLDELWAGEEALQKLGRKG